MAKRTKLRKMDKEDKKDEKAITGEELMERMVETDDTFTTRLEKKIEKRLKLQRDSFLKRDKFFNRRKNGKEKSKK